MYHDVPVVWGVCERAELPAPAEVLFNDPERAKAIDIHQVPWPDVWYRHVIERALQLFTTDEADAFRVWLARKWDTECTLTEKELPLDDDECSIAILPTGGLLWDVEPFKYPEWDLPFKVFGRVYCRDGRWEYTGPPTAEWDDLPF